MKKTFYLYVLSFIFLSSFPALATPSFDQWLADFKREAAREGVSQGTLEIAFKDVRPIPKVIQLDRKQPESKLSFAEYKARVINQARIDEGRRLYRKHKNLLDEIGRVYGVPAHYIVALWGIETSYGNNTGGFGVIPALATLAHDGRRSSFFRAELIGALKILDGDHIKLADMKGSWAGAMGQNQFMPSSFHAYAVDYDGDGRRDIWTTQADVFASTANYLKKSGWKADERWGRKVQAPAGLPESLTGLDHPRPLSEWKGMGVTLPGGGAIPVVPGMKAALIRPDGADGPAYLAYDNYRVIMRWNKSVYFATCVGLLADLIMEQES